jgi:cytochrome c553
MNVTSRFASWRAVLAPVVLLAGGALLTGCPPAAAHTPQAGHDLYESCKSCHGAHGEGAAYVSAPSIAGLPKWYVEATVRKFRTGLRGAHPDDVEGLRMRPMSRQMASDAEIETVSAYVASMTPVRSASTLTGDASAGQATYAVCAACHGQTGMGNEQLKAPPIAGQADWYLLSSLKKFKSGVRGTAPGDITGSQMRPMAMTLADEQAMKNVIAHIATLSGR